MTIAAPFATVPLKRLITSIASGVSVNASDVPAEPGQLGVLKTSCVYTGTFDPSENKTVVPEELERVACPVLAGTLVVSRMNTPDLVGAAGLVVADAPGIYLPDRLWQVSFDRGAAEPRFVYWWTRSELYREQVKMACAGASSSMQNLDQGSFRTFEVPRQSLAQQECIANFLDERTARIDALIAEKERLFRLLDEYRQASISEAVTAGVDGASLKRTVVSGFREVAAHWTVGIKLQSLVLPEYNSFVNGPFGSDLLAHELTNDGVPVIYIRDFSSKGYSRVSTVHVTPEKASQLAFCNVLPGDVLVAKVGEPPGSCAIYPISEPPAIMTQDVIRLRVNPKVVDAMYLVLLLNSAACKEAVDFISVASTRTRVSLGDYKQLRVAMPDLKEQQRIRVAVQRKLLLVDELLVHVGCHISRLREYRSSLISAAVTGQLDIESYTTSASPKQ